MFMHVNDQPASDKPDVDSDNDSDDGDDGDDSDNKLEDHSVECTFFCSFSQLTDRFLWNSQMG